MEGSIPSLCSHKSSRPHRPCHNYKEKVKGFQLPEVLCITCWTASSVLLSQPPCKRLYCAYVCDCMNGYCKCMCGYLKEQRRGGDSHLLAAGAIQTTELINGLLLSPFDCFTCICSPRRGSESFCVLIQFSRKQPPSFYSELWHF